MRSAPRRPPRPSAPLGGTDEPDRHRDARPTVEHRIGETGSARRPRRELGRRGRRDSTATSSASGRGRRPACPTISRSSARDRQPRRSASRVGSASTSCSAADVDAEARRSTSRPARPSPSSPRAAMSRPPASTARSGSGRRPATCSSSTSPARSGRDGLRRRRDPPRRADRARDQDGLRRRRSSKAAGSTDLAYQSTSGDLRLKSELGDGPHAIGTVSGDAIVTSRNGIRVAAQTVAGDLTSDLPHTSEGRPGRRSLIVGSGSTVVQFRSVSGDLRVVGPTATARSTAGPRRRARAAVAAHSTDSLRWPRRPFVTASTAGAGTASTRRRQRTTRARPGRRRPPRVLRALERGEIDIEEATRRLASLDEPTDD